MPQHCTEIHSPPVPPDVCPVHLFPSEIGSYSFVKTAPNVHILRYSQTAGKIAPTLMCLHPSAQSFHVNPNGALALPLVDSLF